MSTVPPHFLADSSHQLPQILKLHVLCDNVILFFKSGRSEKRERAIFYESRMIIDHPRLPGRRSSSTTVPAKPSRRDCRYGRREREGTVELSDLERDSKKTALYCVRENTIRGREVKVQSGTVVIESCVGYITVVLCIGFAKMCWTA